MMINSSLSESERPDAAASVYAEHGPKGFTCQAQVALPPDPEIGIGLIAFTYARLFTLIGSLSEKYEIDPEQLAEEIGMRRPVEGSPAAKCLNVLLERQREAGGGDG